MPLLAHLLLSSSDSSLAQADKTFCGLNLAWAMEQGIFGGADFYMVVKNVCSLMLPSLFYIFRIPFNPIAGLPTLC
jgi:hypothetical protein